MTAPIDQYQDTPHDQSAAAVLAAYLTATAAVRSRLLALVTTAYAAQGDYRDAAAEAFVAAVVPAVQAAQQTMAHLTSAYLAHLVSAAGGGTTAPVAIPAEAVSNLRGVDPTEVYRRPYEQLWYDLSQGKSLTDAVEAGQRRALSLASTDVQLAKTRASQIALSDDRRVVGYRRVLVGTHSCGMCVVASSVRYHKSNLMPIHPGCVIGNTKVGVPSDVGGSAGQFTPSQIRAVTRRSYTGKLITITTAVGKQVTITPNHPVLTDQGWVPADLIKQGDSVVSSDFSHRTVSSSPDKQQTPALIEDVWRSASMPGFVRVPLSSKDFHGDGSDSEVDIVYTDSSLPLVGNIPQVEPMGKLLLVGGHWSGVSFPGGSSFASLFPGSFSAGSGNVGSFSLSSSFFSGHFCRAYEASLRSTSDFDSRMLQGFTNSSSIYSENIHQRQFGLALEVARSDFDMRQVSPSASPRRFDPSGAEFSGQGLLVYAGLGRSLLDRLAGQVQVDRVVSVSASDVMACQVFNLHTGEGWYNAGGLIVSNCDCAIAPILGTIDPGRTINSAIMREGSTEQAIGSQGMKFFEHDDVIEVGDLLTEAHDAVRDTFGNAAADAHRIDYRKIIMVREHGELGPTLTVASHNFTKAQVESGDLKAKAGTFHTVKGREVTNIGE